MKHSLAAFAPIALGFALNHYIEWQISLSLVPLQHHGKR
jgi:hypothetical protein